METRVDLSEDVLAAVQERAARSGRTIAQIIDDVLRDSLCDGRAEVYEERRTRIEAEIVDALARSASKGDASRFGRSIGAVQRSAVDVRRSVVDPVAV